MIRQLIHDPEWPWIIMILYASKAIMYMQGNELRLVNQLSLRDEGHYCFANDGIVIYYVHIANIHQHKILCKFALLMDISLDKKLPKHKKKLKVQQILIAAD